MSTVVGSHSGIKAMISDGGGGVEVCRCWLLEWGNSPSAAMFWAILGCICSFFCPLFLYLKEGQAVGDVGPIRLTIMLLSSVAAARVYRVGFVLRHHRIMHEEPPLLGLMVGTTICCSSSVALAVIFMEGTWPTVVGLELLAVAVFVLLEMARPAVDFFMLRFFVCLPIIAGGRRHGRDFIPLSLPMIIVAVMFLLWREFFLEHRGSPSGLR